MAQDRSDPAAGGSGPGSAGGPSKPANLQRTKFLGLAFAGADLVFEVDLRGDIVIALGAIEQITGRGHKDVVGANWSTLVEQDDADLLEALVKDLRPGERRGPLQVGLPRPTPGSPRRTALLSVFSMPQNPGYLSCALVVGAPVRVMAPRNATGFLEPADMDTTARALIDQAAANGQQLGVALLQLDGLEASLAGQTPGAADSVKRKIAAILRLESFGGVGASEVVGDRFAVLRPSGMGTEGMIARLQDVCGDEVKASGAELGLSGATQDQNLRALRFALDRFIENEPGAVAIKFDDLLARTAGETSRFRTMLARNSFKLVYQPVVALADQKLHHFEALARFAGEESPQASLRLAEEVGLIVDFDLAVVKMTTAALLRSGPSVRIAVNLSALSLMQPQAVESLVRMTAGHAELRGRMLIEITETQRLQDLTVANRTIGELRQLGHPVCIDDFGAGAASLEYIGNLEVDFIKIDGRYVRGLDRRPRDATIVKHVARLCTDLGVATIAEMVEDPSTAEALKTLGVQLAQGWHFGKPTDLPVWPVPGPQKAAARRVGAIEGWS